MKRKNNYTFAFDKKIQRKYKIRRFILIAVILAVLSVVFAFGLNHYLGSKNESTEDINNSESNNKPNIEDNSDNSDNSADNETDENDENLDKDTDDNTISDNVINKGDKEDTSENSDADGEKEIPKVPDESDENKDTVDVEDKEKEDYDFALPVPKTEEANEDFMKDSVFIGNSIVDGLKLYQIIEDADVFSAKGIMVDTIFTKEVIKVAGGERVTIFDAMKGNEYKNIYILLGANELGWPYIEAFIQQYEKVIDKLEDMYPQAKIYINGITPVTARKSASTSIYTNEKIAYFNKNILEMCEDRNLYYIDSVEALGDENDELPEEESVDGTHFKVDTYNIWVDYLKHHTVNPEKYNNID